ncbi:pyridoxamine 5'-phosphate oxidase family protein [Paramicrobacterium agarici]|uniref:General stress protein 26 n=1 Tax=Paramicrobacterium agarici TaxID=630514 RepID=A0A2A9DXI5_9MICO|nr:pyridoxamine 5'-phosphate oxidase family protein [Microbacterium agarici]PFG30629.1 general stress protein 26 [Microbacterium agarici]
MSMEDIRTVAGLVKKAKIALLTTRTTEGKLVSRPLAVQEVEFDGDLWFFSKDPSHKTEQISRDPQVNVAMQAGMTDYVSISGHAEVVHDRSRVDEYWSPAVEAFFPSGKDDPELSLVVVHADTAEYWKSDDPTVVTMFKLAKSSVTGEHPDAGTNKTLDL